MKKFTFTILLFACIASYGQNLISNGDFEFGATGIDVFGWIDDANVSVFASDVDTGNNATRVAALSQDFRNLEQYIELAPGVTYTVSFRYAWITCGNANYAITPQIRRGPTSSLNFGTLSALSTTPDTWLDYTADFTVSTADQIGRLKIVKFNGSCGLRIDDVKIEVKPDITWSGAVDGNLATAANWTGGVPTATDVVVIPNGVTNYPSTGTVTFDELFVEHGASITSNTASALTGNLHYFVNIPDDKWHLVSSIATTYKPDSNWVIANKLDLSGTNDGLATYQNATTDGTTGPWVYLQNDATFGDRFNFSTPKGYAIKKTAPGAIIFNGTGGTYNPFQLQYDIARGAATQWNLIANSFPSYINIATFLANAQNQGALDDSFEFVYVWNASTDSYDALNTGHIYPGQAYFLNAAEGAGLKTKVDNTMKSHQTSATFYKSSTPTIRLKLTYDGNLKTTEVSYMADKTKGLDPGFDAGLFDGVAQDYKLYTHLVEDNNGIAFTKQVLPLQDMQTTVVAVGLKAAAGTQVSFTAEAAKDT